MPNADPNDLLRQTPPEVFAFLEELIGRMDSTEADELFDDFTEEGDIRRQGLLRQVLRGLRERDVMSEVLVRYEILHPDNEPLETFGLAEHVRAEIAKKEHLWGIPE